MRKATRSDYDHFESCGGSLVGNYGQPEAFAIERIGDFFWNKDEPEDGKFSIRLHGDDIAYRSPLRVRDGLASARFARYAQEPRAWALSCHCGNLTLTTNGVMRFWDEGSDMPSLVYVHFEPGFETEAAELSQQA